MVLPLVCLAGCGRKLTPDEAKALVQRVQTARRSLSLRGTLVTSINLRGKELHSDAEMQRGPGVIQLKYTSGQFAGWRIIEQDGYVWRVSPDGKAMASPIGPEPGLGLPAQDGLEVTKSWPTRLAGRWATQYAIVPKGQQVGRLEVAVDRQTSYPLQMRRYGPTGEIVSETTYSQVQYGVAPPTRVKPPAVAQQREHGRGLGQGAKTTEPALVQTLGGPLLKPTYIPAGLQLNGFYTRQTRRGVLAEMRYSDGLRTLVVAQMKIPARAPGAARPGAGASNGTRQRPGAAAWERWQQRRAQAGGKAGDRDGDGARSGWWQRWRNNGAPGQPGTGAGRQRRSLVHERRGDRAVLVGGDLPQEELRKVLASIPYPAGQKPSTSL